MSTEQQTQKFLAAFLASGLDVTEVVGEWRDGKGRCRLEYVRGGFVRLRWVPSPVEYSPFSSHAEPYSDHEAACMILRAMQDKLDEEGVEIVLAYREPRGFQGCRAGDSVVQYDDGSVAWLHTDRPTTFTSRPLATLAAFLAVQGGAK